MEATQSARTRAIIEMRMLSALVAAAAAAAASTARCPPPAPAAATIPLLETFRIVPARPSAHSRQQLICLPLPNPNIQTLPPAAVFPALFESSSQPRVANAALWFRSCQYRTYKMGANVALQVR